MGNKESQIKEDDSFDSEQNRNNQENSVEYAQNLTTQLNTDTDDLKGNYTLLNLQTDIAYGEIKVLRSKNGDQLVAVKSKIFQDKQEQDDYHQNVFNMKRLTHPSLISILDVELTENNQFCGSTYAISTTLEYHPKRLDMVLHDRSKQQEHYSEAEIILQLKAIVNGLCYLDKYKIVHGNLTTKQILITEKQQIKIGIPEFLTTFHWQNYKLELEQECFLAPELFARLNFEDPSQYIDYQKADIYSLGIVALQMALFEETDSIYDRENLTVDSEKVNKKLFKVQKIYGSNLMNLLANFLQEEESRSNLQQCQKMLENYILQEKTSIKNESPSSLKQFQNQKLNYFIPQETSNKKEESPIKQFSNQKSDYFIPQETSNKKEDSRLRLYYNQKQERPQTSLTPQRRESESKIISIQTSPKVQKSYLKNIDNKINKESFQSKKKNQNRQQLREYLKNMLYDENFTVQSNFSKNIDTVKSTVKQVKKPILQTSQQSKRWRK